jgi:hypothetical protein
VITDELLPDTMNPTSFEPEFTDPMITLDELISLAAPEGLTGGHRHL